jgi:hypothetical protein
LVIGQVKRSVIWDDAPIALGTPDRGARPCPERCNRAIDADPTSGVTVLSRLRSFPVVLKAEEGGALPETPWFCATGAEDARMSLVHVAK